MLPASEITFKRYIIDQFNLDPASVIDNTLSSYLNQ